MSNPVSSSGLIPRHPSYSPSIADDAQPVGRAYNAIRDAVTRGWHDRMHFIDFEDLTQYPDLLRRLSEAQGEVNSYSVAAVVVALGGSSLAGHIVTVLVGVPLLVASVYFGRRVSDDERSFIAVIGASLLLTPVVWLHYFVLLAVPLAIARPRFSLLWVLPIVLWVCPRDGNGDGLQPVVPMLVAVALIAVLLVRPRSVAVAATS
jgi:hypothetical protein